MVRAIKRLKVVYKDQLPKRLEDFLAANLTASVAKGGLCDWPPIRAFCVIVNVAWTNSHLDPDALKKLLAELETCKRAGLILGYEQLS